MTTLGQRAKLARGARSRALIAKKAGIAYTTLADIENGHTQTCTTIASLAKALEVIPIWLETGEGSMRQPEQPTPDVAHFQSRQRHARQLVQDVCDLADQISDDGLRELLGIARYLTGTHPLKKAANHTKSRNHLTR